MKISACSNYDNTQLKEYNNNKVSHNWEVQEVAWEKEAIVTLTTEYGISCNEYTDGHRRNDSWIATHAIMLDFDDGRLSTESLLKKQQGWEFNSYIFSSQNHQKEKNGQVCDRLRVLIPLSEPIRSDSDLEIIKEDFLKRFPLTDKVCMDKARWFAHGTTEVSSFVGNKTLLNWKGLLPKRPVGRPKENDEEIYSFTLETELRNKDGQPIVVRNVLEKTIIYCPVCGFADFRNNEGHNAFIDINDKHLYFIYCSSCESRKQGVSGKGVYNLNSVDAYLLKTKELNTAVFIDRNTCQFHSVSVENEKVMVDLIRGQYFAEQFCKSKNLPIPKAFPHVRLEHRFDSDRIIDFDKGFVNKYIAPDVLKAPVPVGFEAKIPEYIERLINHVFAEDREIIDHFLNDLAYLVQTRKKLITSYLMQGTEGTGKGLLFKHVLRKMFGEKWCSETDMDAFDSRFNDFLTDNFLVLVSEISANFTNGNRNGFSIVEKIKMAITDQYIQIEAKGRPRQLGENNCSFLFATNRRHGLVLSNDDRRFNVAPRQEVKLQNTDWWPGYGKLVKLLAEELQDFVWFLKSKPVQDDLVGTVISNAPKKLLQSMSTTDVEDFFNAINTGDGDWLQENIVRKYSYNSDKKFESAKGIMRDLKDTNQISTTDLCELYNFTNNKDLTPKSFTKMAKLYLKEEIKQLGVPGTHRPRGIKTENMKFSNEMF